LADIFDREDLQKAVHSLKFEEKIYNPKDKITSQGLQYNKILYVARGMIVEKEGEYDDMLIPPIKYKRG